MLRDALRKVLEGLLAESAVEGAVTLDAIGDAIGARAVSLDEIEAIIAAIEHAGRRIVAPEGGGGEGRLGKVLEAARALRAAGEVPTVAAIVRRTGLTTEQVRHALALAQVMQR